MSSDDVTVKQFANGQIETWDEARQFGTALSAREVAALREYFAAERMPEDVPALVARVRELEAQRAAVLAVHRADGQGRCVSCLAYTSPMPQPKLWPCATVLAMNEGEK